MKKKRLGFLNVNFQHGPREFNNYYLPYSAGVIIAYAMSQPDIGSTWQCDYLGWRREPVEQTAQQLKDFDIVAFSTYVWNRNYNYTVAKRIKELNPDCTIIVGGPEPPITDPDIFQILPFVDVVIKLEGEFIFADVLRNHGGNLENIPGLLINQQGKVFDTGTGQRITDLDQLPSPYLTGVFDKIIQDNPEVTWSATVETNRGCPYACTFCDWGSLTYDKVKKFGLERVYAELEWVGERCGYVFFTDANFGIFVERDSLIVDKLLEVQKKWNKVKNFTMTWAKNKKSEIVQIVKKLIDNSPSSGQGLTVSVQSMDPTVLKNIKRQNLEEHQIEEIFALCDRLSIPVYTELILGLPGETSHSWKNNIWRLFRAGQHTGVAFYQANLLENAEMNLSQRKFWKLEGRPMYDYVNGSYHGDEVDESIEVVVSTRDIPKNEMLETMTWTSFIQTFHVNGISTYIARYLYKAHGIDYSDFYDKLYVYLQALPWWREEFSTTKSYYQEWFENGRIRHPKVGRMEVVGWNLYNRTTVNLLAQGKLADTYAMLKDFISQHYQVPALDELILFQQWYVIDHGRMNEYPQRIHFEHDFLGYIQDNTDIDAPVLYEFDTPEDKTMSLQTFLENFYFGRKRNFGKSRITKTQ